MNTRFLYLITGSSQSVSIYRWEIEAKISVSVSISRFLRLGPLLYKNQLAFTERTAKLTDGLKSANQRSFSLRVPDTTRELTMATLSTVVAGANVAVMVAHDAPQRGGHRHISPLYISPLSPLYLHYISTAPSRRAAKATTHRALPPNITRPPSHRPTAVRVRAGCWRKEEGELIQMRRAIARLEEEEANLLREMSAALLELGTQVQRDKDVR